jgi:hypothetical protein
MSAIGTNSLLPASLERSVVGCCLYDAVTAEADVEPRRVRPGSGLKTLGRDENRLAHLSNCDFSTSNGPLWLNGR